MPQTKSTANTSRANGSPAAAAAGSTAAPPPALPPADFRPGLDVTVDRKGLRKLLADIPGGAKPKCLGTLPAKQTAVVLHALGHRDVYLRAGRDSAEVGRRLAPGRALVGVAGAGAARLPVNILRTLCDKLADDRLRIQSVPAEGRFPRLVITTTHARFELDQYWWKALDRISPAAAPSAVSYDPSAAARKAWVTRLARPDFDASAAARKAWATRRERAARS